ncbi:hypothetical protein [Brucella pituitosa]
MPQTSTLWHSLVALPHLRRGLFQLRRTRRGASSFENGEGEFPDPIMLETARRLIENDEEVEPVIIDTILSDMPRLRAIQNGNVLGDEDKPLPESCE